MLNVYPHEQKATRGFCLFAEFPAWGFRQPRNFPPQAPREKFLVTPEESIFSAQAKPNMVRCPALSHIYVFFLCDDCLVFVVVVGVAAVAWSVGVLMLCG